MTPGEFTDTESITRNEIILPYVTMRYQNPIVFYTYKEGTELGFPEVRELIASAEKLSGGKPYFTLADVRAGISITNEGKRIVSDMNNMPLFRGTAAVVKNGFFRYAANFLKTFNSTKYPFRAFTSEEKAISWLLSLPF